MRRIIFFYLISVVILLQNCWAQILIQPFSDGEWTTKKPPSHLRIMRLNSTPELTESERNIASLIDVFKFTRTDLNWFDMHFDIKSIELIYPKSWDQTRQLKRCVLGMKFKRSLSRSAAIKIEFDSLVRSRYDERERKIVCSVHQGRRTRGMPTERYIANLVRSNPYFIKFYPHLSKQFTPSTLTSSSNSLFPSLFPSTPPSTINSYVYTRLGKSSDLLAFTGEMRSIISGGANNQALENVLRKHFARMHRALTTLKRAGFVYTDFKPENVLVDTKADRAYLIDLESIVTANTGIVCLRTPIYAPPLFSVSGRLMDVDGLSSLSAQFFFNTNVVSDPYDRILSWTFCFSIYVLMCQRPVDLPKYSGIGHVRKNLIFWARVYDPFINFYGCATGSLSKELTDMLNSCLVRAHVKAIFPGLIRHAWFKSETTLPFSNHPTSFTFSTPVLRTLSINHILK